MSLNFSRQTFIAVFVPLLLVAGLFWLSEIRGYRGEMSLLVLPKTEFGKGAARNLAAIAKEIPFAGAVYESEEQLENKLSGKTIGEKHAFWKKTVTVTAVGQSDLIRISVRGEDQDEALLLVKTIATEVVRTGSRYYNQKTDIDIRIIEEPGTIPSLTAWPRFFGLVFVTAFSFTTLFFIIYELVNRLFPKRKKTVSSIGEYTISPETFKPQMPAYWKKETETLEPLTLVTKKVEAALSEPIEEAEDTTFTFEGENESRSFSKIESGTRSDVESEPVNDLLQVVDSYEEASAMESPKREVVSPVDEGQYESEVAIYNIQHAAAPDNLPVLDGPLTPLQGAQARLMKEDIDATRDALSAESEVEEIDRSVSSRTPLTHEPTPEEYKRRLNDLLSGKI